MTSSACLLLLLLVAASPLQSAPLPVRRHLATAQAPAACGQAFDVAAAGTECTVDVPAGSKLLVATKFLPGANCTGDTWLRLFWDGEEVAYSDDFNINFLPFSLCSLLSYTAPNGQAGTYTVSQGCFSSSSGDPCAGVVALLVVPADTFSCTGVDVGVCAALKALFMAQTYVFQYQLGWFAAQTGERTEYCAFAGLSCTDDGFVTSLDFSAFSYIGDAFPDGFFSAFTGLTRLVLASLQIPGPFPTGILDLTALTYLDLSFNQFEGSIPDGIGSLTALETFLLVGNNNVNGSIPETVGDLTMLKTLCVR